MSQRRRSVDTVLLASLVVLAAAALGCSSTEDSEPIPSGSGGSPGGGAGKGGAGAGGAASGSGGATGGSGGAGMDAAAPDAPADGNGDDGSTAPIQMKIAWWGSQDRHDRTIAVLKLFEQKHPEVHFSTEYDASTPYWTKMYAHAAGGTLPDIMQQDYAYITEWASKGWLLPLDDLAGAGGSLDLSDVPPAIVDHGRIGGKLVGVSLGSNTQCFVLDVDAFQAAGVALPTDTWTWPDFESKALEIKAKSNLWGFGTALYLYTPWKSLFLSDGTWVFSPDNKRVGWIDDSPWVEHWKRELRLQTAGAIPTYDQEQAEFKDAADVTKTPIVVKRSAMEQIHSNQLLALWNAAGTTTRNFKLVAMPRLAGKGASVYIKPSQYLSVLAGTTHPKEAAMLLDFFTNDLDANAILQAERGVPVAGKVFAALKPGLAKAQVEAFDLLDRVSKDARVLPLPDPPQWDQILNTVYKPQVTVPILHGTLSPEDGVALYKREANAILAGATDGGVGDGGGSDGGDDAGGPDGGDAAGGDGPSDKHVLLVVGATPLVGNDKAIHDRLALKLQVDDVPEATATGAMATGKALVLITSTVSQAVTDIKFRDVTVPVILLEPNLMPAMRMTADDPAAHGTLTNQTKITILAAGNPLAANFTGDVTVYSAPEHVVYGAPAPAALKVASVVGNADRVAIFAYPTGAAMVGGTAPAKRIAFFLHESLTADVTEDGFKLLDAAVDWSLAL